MTPSAVAIIIFIAISTVSILINIFQYRRAKNHTTMQLLKAERKNYNDIKLKYDKLLGLYFKASEGRKESEKALEDLFSDSVGESVLDDLRNL